MKSRFRVMAMTGDRWATEFDVPGALWSALLECVRQGGAALEGGLEIGVHQQHVPQFRTSLLRGLEDPPRSPKLVNFYRGDPPPTAQQVMGTPDGQAVLGQVLDLLSQGNGLRAVANHDHWGGHGKAQCSV